MKNDHIVSLLHKIIFYVFFHKTNKIQIKQDLMHWCRPLCGHHPRELFFFHFLKWGGPLSTKNKLHGHVAKSMAHHGGG